MGTATCVNDVTSSTVWHGIWAAVSDRHSLKNKRFCKATCEMTLTRGRVCLPTRLEPQTREVLP